MKKIIMSHPWVQMWTKPKQTIASIIQEDEKKGFLILSFLYGFAQSFYFAQYFSLGMVYEFWMNILLAAIFAVPVGVVYFSVSTYVIYLVGKVVRGKGSYHQIRAANAWSNVTQIASLAFVLPLILYFKNAYFIASFFQNPFEGGALFLVFFYLISQLVLSIWTFILFVLSLAEVQKFSVWRALLNIALVVLFYFVLILAIGEIITLTTSSNIAFFQGKI